jgi:hypothetical protein
MRPLEVESPGWGTRARCEVICQFDSLYFSRFFLKYQWISRLFFLESLIPADSYFEQSLSLAIDRAVVALEVRDDNG